MLVLVGALAANGSRANSSKHHSDTGWSGEPFRADAQLAYQAYQNGNWREAESRIRLGAEKALAAGQPRAAAQFLSLLAAVQTRQSHFREAVATYQHARSLSAQSGDWEEWAAGTLNLSWLYVSMHDAASASAVLEQALEKLKTIERPYYEPEFLTAIAYRWAAEGRPGWRNLLWQSIDRARNASLPEGLSPAARSAWTRRLFASESLAWSHLGSDALRKGDLELAERALTEAFRIRLLFRLADLPSSRFWLAELRLRQGDAEAAWNLNRAAFGDAGGGSLPTYLLLQQRARIRAARGEELPAFADWKEARMEAARWRAAILPAEGFQAGLDDDLFSKDESPILGFVRKAMRRYQRQPDPELAFEMLAAVEDSRGASIEVARQKAALAGGLPAEYWETLAELRRELSESLQGRGSPGARALLEIRLQDLERSKGIILNADQAESFPLLKSLKYFRSGISQGEAFFSFLLDKDNSYRWCVVDQRIQVSLLPGRATLEAKLDRFKKAILDGEAGWQAEAGSLYQELFGSLPDGAGEKELWSVSADGSLWNTPLAALVAGWKGDRPEYLAERHAIRLLPRLAAAGGLRRTGETLLAMGDPIYNQADERLGARPGWRLFPARASSGLTLPRLRGSGVETDRVADYWSGRSVVLRGGDVTRERLQRLLEQEAPAVVHVATHVLSPAWEGSADLAVALAMGAQGSVELLTREDIRHLPVNGAVVVLSGCGSGQGEVHRGAGLFGLTRSFVIAGAGAVLASLWPVPDDEGRFFEGFYRSLPQATPAKALQRAQREAIRGGGWRAEPRYWAAYNVTGGLWRE